MEDVVQIIVGGIIALFIVCLIYVFFAPIIGGYIKPLILEMNPNSTVGVSSDQYVSMADKCWNGFRWGIYLIILAIFVFVGFKLFYQKEETSQQYGYYG